MERFYAQVSLITGSHECFNLIREWLRLCPAKHLSCSLKQDHLERPTRLLEIVSHNKSVRVIEGE